MEEERQQGSAGREPDLGTERPPPEMLKDLVLRWFLDVQEPLLSQDGSLPGWFHGFITRKQTEELLNDKALGCFLIRLRGRAFGYILSYRGKDRCRHFVISCQKNGRYVVSGDTQGHESLAELVRYYQVSEIEPFGETLTVACSKPEEKNIYDEISLEPRTPAEPNPELGRQGSGSSPTASPAGKAAPGQQSAKSRRKLQEQQKTLSKEGQSWSLESPPGDEPEASPPIPDRSSLLRAEYPEENKTTIYTALKHLKEERVEHSADMDRSFSDLEDPGQGNPHLKPSDKFCGRRTAEAGRPGTIYSEIGADQPKSSLTPPESRSTQPSPLTMPKKSGRNSPTSTPPKLSPKLPDKPKTPTKSQGLQETPRSASPSSGERHQIPSPSGASSDPPGETLYGQVHKLRSQKPPACVSDDPYERIPFEWPRHKIHGRGSEGLPESSALKAREDHEQAGTKSSRSARTQSYSENTYEKIPMHLAKSSSARQSPGDSTYEKISFVPGRGAEAKPSHKNEKPRRFLFADKKTKF